MRKNLARSALLVIIAMSAGLALGVVTKFGLGYALPTQASQIESGAP
jgi:hypothetical protein